MFATSIVSLFYKNGNSLLFSLLRQFLLFPWKVKPNRTLNLGLRYKRPGNAIQSLADLNEKIFARLGSQDVFRLTSTPVDHNKNFQPRFGFSWEPRPTSNPDHRRKSAHRLWNFGIPEARINNTGFGNQWGTDGGSRRIFLAVRFTY